MAQPVILLGNPENRRVSFFQDALASHGFAHAEVLSWADYFRAPEQLDELLSPSCTLRIDSPGENAQVLQEMLRAGASHPRATISREALEHTHAKHGEVFHPLQRFLGWQATLEQLAEQLDGHPSASSLRVMNHPRDILAMFDKERSYHRMRAANVAVPLRIDGVTDYDSLRRRMQEEKQSRVFIKLLHGSSASGVVAYRARGERESAITSSKLVQDPGEPDRIYNSLRIQHYTESSSIRRLIDLLAAQDVVVEQWLPKSSIDRRAFDMRVVVIAGKATHVVARSSRSPMTNLHLGNQRESRERIIEAYGEEAFHAAMHEAEKAATAFPDSFYFGADVMMCSNSLEPVVIEVNAFGDLLPNLLVDGMDTYQTEVARWFEQAGGAS